MSEKVPELTALQKNQIVWVADEAAKLAETLTKYFDDLAALHVQVEDLSNLDQVAVAFADPNFKKVAEQLELDRAAAMSVRKICREFPDLHPAQVAFQLGMQAMLKVASNALKETAMNQQLSSLYDPASGR